MKHWNVGPPAMCRSRSKPRRWLTTVTRVLARKQAYHSQNRLQDCPAKIECTFYLDNEPARIRPIVDLIQYNLAAVGTGDAMEQIRIGIALEEALLNALYHGNLEISHEDLSRARLSGSTAAMNRLLSERTRIPNLKDRRIVMEVHLTSYTARFVVRDDGDGF